MIILYLMSRFVAIAVFNLRIRVIAAPSLCSHEAHDSVSQPAVEAESCHKHNVEKKHIPCNHMKECLLDAGNDESFVSKAMGLIDVGKYAVFYIKNSAHIFEGFILKADLNPANQSPPLPLLFSSNPVYISISSFLI